MTGAGSEGAVRRRWIASLWQQHRARWTLPLVIIVIIGAVAILDHLGYHRITKVNRRESSVLVPLVGGSATVDLDQVVERVQPQHAVGSSVIDAHAAGLGAAERLCHRSRPGTGREQ